MKSVRDLGPAIRFIVEPRTIDAMRMLIAA